MKEYIPAGGIAPDEGSVVDGIVWSTTHTFPPNKGIMALSGFDYWCLVDAAENWVKVRYGYLA